MTAAAAPTAGNAALARFKSLVNVVTKPGAELSFSADEVSASTQWATSIGGNAAETGAYLNSKANPALKLANVRQLLAHMNHAQHLQAFNYAKTKFTSRVGVERSLAASDASNPVNQRAELTAALLYTRDFLFEVDKAKLR